MAVTESNYTVSNSSTTNYSFTFPYLKTTDVKLSINGVASSAFTFANATTIQLNSNPTVGDKIRIYRETDDSKLEAEFFAGSAIKSSDLNDNFTQNLYVTQESNNKIDAAWTSGDETIDTTETWASNNTRVATTGAIDARVDSKIDTALTTDVVGGQSITITDNSPGSGQITASVTAGSIRGTELAGDSVDGTKIADDSIDSEHIAAGAVDLEHMSANSVDSDQYVDGSIDLAHMSANSVDSDQYVDGSIDTVHIADAQVTTAKVADSNITTAKIADNAITSAKILDDAVSSGKIATGAITTDHLETPCVTTANITDSSVTTSKIAASAVGTSRLNNGAVTTDKIAASAVGSSQLASNSVNSNHYVDGSIDTAHIADAQVTTAKIAADAIDGTKLADNAVSAEHIAANSVGDSEIATGALDNRYYRESELLTDGVLDGRYFTQTASDARYFNISTGDTIKDGDAFPDNDTTIATTAAINDRIIDLVDDVGGFVPIANETSFPNANPDVNNGAGTLISIKALSSSLTSNGSGVATIANGTVGNSTVTITGLANSTTYSSAYGMIVETTTTLNTYTFHRQVPIATEVNTVASNISNVNAVGNNTTNINTVAGNTTNINTVAGANSNITSVAGSISNVNTVATNISNVNDFSDKYRVASSAPTSSLDTGDLYFDTSANELKVYNGSAWQGGVTATGNLAGLGANTFTGNQSLGDDIKIQLGASNDIQIYHNSSQPNSYIKNTATGSFYITTAGGGNLVLQTASSDNAVKCVHNAAVELYYDGSKKFETTSWGAQVTGAIKTSGGGISILTDSQKLTLGAGDDLQIYHDGSNSYILNTTGELQLRDQSRIKLRTDQFVLNNHANDESIIYAAANGAVELYYDGVKQVRTSSTGIYLEDSKRVDLGTGADLRLVHDGSHSYIQNNTGNLRIDGDLIQLRKGDGTENYFIGTANGAVQLYYDGSKKIETTSSGVKFWGTTNHLSWIQVSNDDKLRFNDGVKATFGNSDDLKIYHDGSHSYIANTTGNIYITDDGYIELSSANGGEKYATFSKDGAVELYYDGVKKFETLGSGVKVSGWIYIPDSDGSNNMLRFGDGADLKIYHDGSHSYIKDSGTGNLVIQTNVLGIQAANGLEDLAKFSQDGSAELYYDGSKKFETTSWGSQATGTIVIDGGHIKLGDTMKAYFGAGEDLQIYHDGSNSYIQDSGTGDLIIQATNLKVKGYNTGELAITTAENGAVELYYDNSKKFETVSGGIKFTGNIYGDDAAELRLGTSGDLQIYHDGNNSYINDTGTGRLKLQSNQVQIRNSANTENIAEFTENGAVDLYYDNSKKLETTSTGVNVTGALTVNGAAVGGGTWEILGTHDFASNNATNASNTGWPSTYTQVKCVLNYVGHSGTSDLSMQWYFHSSYGNNGTLNTQTEYKYAATWQQFHQTSQSTGSSDSNCWRFRNGGGSPYWCGEITFDIGTSAKNLKKWAIADLRTGSTWAHRDSCQHQDDSTLDQYIVGCKIFEHAGNNLTHGRVTWYGLKYA